MRVRFVVGLWVMVGVLGGCSDEEGAARLAQVDQPIEGGEVDHETTAVFGSLTLGGGFCTGSLIAPNLVLTAQHCVAQLEEESVRCGETRFGPLAAPNFVFFTSDTNILDGGAIYGARDVLIPPGGDDVCGFDIALVILKENVSAEVARPMVPRIDEPVFADEPYTAVGFGTTGRDGEPAGMRRIRTGLHIVCNGLDCADSASTTETEFAGDDGTCQGDSGGPAIDAAGRVLGALSRGSRFGCSGSIYSSVWGWSDWIRDVAMDAAEVGGYAPARWVVEGTSAEVFDQDDDGVADDLDNCIDLINPDQVDFDEDGEGDACDPDVDGDGVDNVSDSCPADPDPEQGDIDGDGVGDLCDEDMDGDGVDDEADNCPTDPNTDQADADGDGAGDACDDDFAAMDDGASGAGQGGDGGCDVAPGRRGAPPLAALLAVLGWLVLRR